MDSRRVIGCEKDMCEALGRFVLTSYLFEPKRERR